MSCRGSISPTPGPPTKYHAGNGRRRRQLGKARTMAQSVSLTLAQYAASTAVSAIPGNVRERAKQVILDEMASACFGRQRIAGELAARYAADFGGREECRILGTELHSSAPYAALANGTAGHADEIDGAHVVGGHPGASIVHAAVAAAERQRASGAELLNAVVLGYDVGTRVMQACGGIFVAKSRYRLHADFLYAVGAAVAASRILGLDPVRHCHAMSLVTFQANGLCALFQERRHISKSFCNGQYAFAGVSAALMSAAGLEGCDDILGARDGVLDAWGVENGLEFVTRGLGQDYAIMGANFKFLNAGYPIHAAVEAAMTLVADHNIDVDEIASVGVGMPANAMRVVDNREMHNICLQDMLSAALLRSGLTLSESPFPAILGDPAFARMRARVALGVDPALEREQPDGRGANVTITTAEGVTISRRVDHPRGHSLRGAITWSDLSAKWHDALPGYEVERMITAAQGLDDLDDVKDLSETFTGKRH
jgi:2-methylcitrate dehydratase PrpD